jgi:hypothetical protein
MQILGKNPPSQTEDGTPKIVLGFTGWGTGPTVTSRNSLYCVKGNKRLPPAHPKSL